MASNCYEWSTEYSANITKDKGPCNFRGGVFDNSNVYASYRSGGKNNATYSYYHISFRPLLYLK